MQNLKSLSNEIRLVFFRYWSHFIVNHVLVCTLVWLFCCKTVNWHMEYTDVDILWIRVRWHEMIQLYNSPKVHLVWQTARLLSIENLFKTPNCNICCQSLFFSTSYVLVLLSKAVEKQQIKKIETNIPWYIKLTYCEKYRCCECKS